MATYFETHKPRLHQWQATRDPERKGRFHEATGTIVIHTFEAPVSKGVKWAADLLVNRTDRQASYHCLAGPASQRDVLQLVPWSGAAWHETNSNRWSIGISMVTQAAAWSRISATQRDNLVASAAYAAYLAASWLKSARGITVPAKRITRAQAMNGRPGFIGHGEMDPGRRTDPGAGFPWDEFLTIYAALMAGPRGSQPTPDPQEDDDMTPEQYELLVQQNAQALNDIKALNERLDALPNQIWSYRDPKVTPDHAYRHLLQNRSQADNIRRVVQEIVTHLRKG